MKALKMVHYLYRLGGFEEIKNAPNIALNDIEPKELWDRLAECVLFRGIRMQQLTQQQNLGRVEGLCQLGVAEVVVRAAERDSIVIGQIVQHGQEIEGFWVPFSVIVGTDLVVFQELGDEG